MFPYWLLFAIPALATLSEYPRLRPWLARATTPFVLAAALICVIVGLRYEVGSDWITYLTYLDRHLRVNLNDISITGDPGYILVNWLAALLGADIWLVNLVCAALFSWGLTAFCNVQPRPWLALCIAVPYLVVVVAMGYTRQAVAIGCAMMALATIARGGERAIVKFVLWVVIATTFHKSAVLLIPLVAVTVDRGRLWTIAWVAMASLGAYYVLVADRLDSLTYIYIEREYDSEGALIRSLINAVPAVLFLVFRKRYPLFDDERRLWTIVSLLALATLPALAISQSSTAVDRVSLYFIPLQMMMLSRTPDAFATGTNARRFITLLIVLYSAAMLFVWLNFGSHAGDWLPYTLYPL